MTISILESMKNDGLKAETELSRERKWLYERVSKPLKLTPDERHIRSLLQSMVKDFIVSLIPTDLPRKINDTDYQTDWVLVTVSTDFKLGTVGIECDLSLTERVTAKNLQFTYSSDKKLKPVKALKAFLSEYIKFLEYEADLEQFQKFYKRFITKFKVGTETLWAVFTNVDCAKWCLSVAQSQNCTSCMSDPAESYGNLENGEWIHPLQGYDYSPDFRLALFTRINPNSEEFKNTEHPFIARAFVTYPDDLYDDRLQYTRTYGDETVDLHTYYSQFIASSRPTGRQFWCIESGRGDMTYKSYFHKTLSETITETGGRVLVAPYIDSFSNQFDLSNKPYTLPNGLTAYLATVVDPKDETTRSAGYYSMHYQTGVVNTVWYPDDEEYYDSDYEEWMPFIVNTDGNFETIQKELFC